MLDWEERKVCIKRMVTSPAALLLPSAVLLSRRGLPLDASPPSSLMPDESPDHAAVDQRDLNGSFTGADGTPSGPAIPAIHSVASRHAKLPVQPLARRHQGLAVAGDGPSDAYLTRQARAPRASGAHPPRA